MSKESLMNLAVKVVKIEINKSFLRYFKSDAFDSTPFQSSLESIQIDNENAAHNQIFNIYPITGLKKLKTYFITNNPQVQIMERPSLGTKVSGTLDTIRIRNTASAWNLSSLFSASSFPKLTYLDFSNNVFPSINILWFPAPAIENVEVVILSTCMIETIDGDTFNNFKKLVSISLSYNRLTNIPMKIFDHLIPLGTSIRIGSNMFHCDCSLADLQDLLLAYPVQIQGTLANPSRIECASPAEHLGKNVIEVQLCEPVETTLAFSTTLDVSPSDSTADICNGIPCTTITPTSTLSPTTIPPKPILTTTVPQTTDYTTISTSTKKPKNNTKTTIGNYAIIDGLLSVLFLKKNFKHN